jgi:pimeloyl-ACP methyl ester carboxylesterase
MPELQLRGGEVDGLRLHYVVEGRGPAVILVHGLGGFAETWRHNIEPLARRATVYAVDLPGFGASAKPRSRYRLGNFAGALRGFMDGLGLAQASLVGHSLGGAVSVTYALMHPSRVERLALVGAVVPGCSFRPSWAFRAVAIRGLGEIASSFAWAGLYKACLARCFHIPDRAEVDFFVDYRYAARTEPAARAAYLSTLRDVRIDMETHAHDYRRAMATLELPVLLIHGRQDRVVPASHCDEVAALVPHASVRRVDACGHFPQIEHAEAVNGWLVDFLVGRPAPR